MSRCIPVINMVATGKNIVKLRTERGLSVKDLQRWFGFEEPRAIYKWQHGETLPSVDNLLALGALFEVGVEEILVTDGANSHEYYGRDERPLFYVKKPEHKLRQQGTKSEINPFQVIKP